MTLICEIESFLNRHAMKPSAFGRQAVSDPCLVYDLRAGRRLWPETEAKVRAFMANPNKGKRARAAAA